MDDFYSYNSGNYSNGFGPSAGDPMTPNSSHKKSPGGHRWVKVVALVLVCAIIGTSAGIGGAALYDRFHTPDPSEQPDSSVTVIHESDRPQVETVVNSSHGQPMTPEQLYEANLGSCVGITVSTTMVNIFGQATTSAASGSGFVLTQDGYIVTNFHVVKDAAEDPSVKIEVSFENGDHYSAKLVGSAKDNDVAVLKIDAASNLVPVTLGDSDKLVVGEPVYAIGNPLGELTYSFTNGMISALDRLISTGPDVTLNMLQTNCAINPGNSGGPLFDSYGNVIGITTAKYVQSNSGVSAEGLGFAIPINDVKAIIKDLMEHGYVTGKPYMGVQLEPVSSDAQRYGIPAGAVVLYVADGSAAEKAGLKVNDIIIKLDNTAIDSPSALTAALSTGYKAGQEAVLTVVRDQKEYRLHITFDEKNSQSVANNKMPEQEQPQQLPPMQPGENGNIFHFPFGFFPW